MQQDIDLGLRDVVTAVAVFLFLQKNLGVHVVMKGLGQRQRIVRIRSSLKGIDFSKFQNWQKTNKISVL